MAGEFPSAEWLQSLMDKLNSDERYAQIARNWEGDMYFKIEPGGPLTETVTLYLDLWHGKCRRVEVVDDPSRHQPAFTLTATYDDYLKVLTGKLDPMQAMLTRKLKVQGNMAYMMRNVPVVLDFVRCAREVTE